MAGAPSASVPTPGPLRVAGALLVVLGAAELAFGPALAAVAVVLLGLDPVYADGVRTARAAGGGGFLLALVLGIGLASVGAGLALQTGRREAQVLATLVTLLYLPSGCGLVAVAILLLLWTGDGRTHFAAARGPEGPDDEGEPGASPDGAPAG